MLPVRKRRQLTPERCDGIFIQQRSEVAPQIGFGCGLQQVKRCAIDVQDADTPCALIYFIRMRIEVLVQVLDAAGLQLEEILSHL